MKRELPRREVVCETVGGVAIRTAESHSFANLIMNGAVDLRFGIEPISEGETKITYGAGPCLAGVVYFQDGFYLFHLPPTEYNKKVAFLEGAEWGFIGGGVDIYELYRRKLSPNIIVNRQGYCFSIAASRHRAGVMDIFWRFAF